MDWHDCSCSGMNVFSRMSLSNLKYFKLGTSIVVCNILVLATYLYRVLWNVDGSHGTTTTTTGQISSKRDTYTSGLQTTRDTEQSNSIANNDVITSIVLTDLGTNFGNTPQTSNDTPGPNNAFSLQLNSGLQIGADSQTSQIISSFDFSSSEANSKGQAS